MILSKWIIKYYVDDEKTKLLFSKEYKNVKEILKDWIGLSRNFLYDFPRWQEKGILNSNSRKKKSIEKYKKLEIIKTTYHSAGNVVQSFSL